MIETVPSGTVLHGRYRIERVLGSGGFGHVYLAIDMVNNQQFAVKEYLVTGATGQEQLKHEATVLRNLHHPSLPAFQDAFIERGRYYVVLNYIEGNDLTDLIRMVRQRNEVIPIFQLVSWILAICDGVMFLHSQQPIVIHRDIKPDNIRITPAGTAVLVDLGNAKAAADGARTLFFIRHQGTPGYAPPEQYPGGSGTDARSDIYALGGTLYFALTMHEPPSVSIRNQSVQQGAPTLPSLQEHLANNPAPETPEQLAAQQFRLGVTKPGKPIPRHSRHIAQMGTIAPEVLQRLNAIIQRAMALKPRDRYQYVADFANDLKQVLKALPPPTPPAPSHPSADPHSTQPDLPGLYDALMEAKEQAGQGKNPPSTPSNSAPTCPRCHAPLAPQATFCPRCGNALTPSSPANMGVTHTPAMAQQQDISAEQTLVINPAKSRQAQTMTASPARGPIQAPTTSSPAHPNFTGTGSHYPISSPAPLVSPLQRTPPPYPQNGRPSNGRTPQTSRGKAWLIGLVIAFVVLVIAIIILVILIQNRNHPGAYILPTYSVNILLPHLGQRLAYTS